MTPHPTALPTNWFTEFQAFSLFHLVAVCVCAAAMAWACRRGRRLMLLDRADSDNREWVLRVKLAAMMVVWQAFATGWRLMPGEWDINESLPLHLCRWTGWIAPFALMSLNRRLRALMVFWGLGLSTQGFFTPMWTDGLASVDFWLYWISHLLVVGTAVYDLVVLGYRPGVRCWGFAAVLGLIYAAVVIGANLALGTNYSYLGKGAYEGTSVVDVLGDWPERPMKMIVGAQVLMLVVFGITKLLPKPAGDTTPDADD